MALKTAGHRGVRQAELCSVASAGEEQFYGYMTTDQHQEFLGQENGNPPKANYTEIHPGFARGKQ